MSGLFAAVLIATLIGALSSAGIFVYAWRRRKSPVAATFAGLMALTAVTCLDYVGLWSSPDPGVVYLLARLRFAGLALMAVFYLLFVFEYVGLHPWRHRGRVALLFVVPAITQILLWTNESHGLFFRSWEILRVGPFASEIIVYGPAWQLHALQSYGCMVVGIALLLRTAMRSTGVYAVQALLMFFGSLVVVLINLPITFLLSDKPVPNLTPVSYAIAGAIFMFALQRQRLLDLMPVALDLVYNSLDDAMVVMDQQKRVVSANPAALDVLGQPREDVVGQPLAHAFRARPHLLAQIDALDGTDGEITGGSGADKRYYDLRVSPLTRGGEERGTVLALRDITGRRVAEKRALELTLEQEKIRLLSAFIRDASHDLRTPLTVMNTALYLARKTDDPIRRDAKLSDIEQQIGQIQRIVEGLLLLTSLDSASTMEISVFRLGALVEPLPADLAALVEEKGQTLKLDLRDDTCRGDVTLLRRAVHNLIQNAALYTPKGGTITVRGERNDNQVIVEVEDNGVGIESNDLEGIFDRFSKVNRARTPDGSGAGLGLAIVRKIARLHTGDVTASSIPGDGSIFRLTIPASQRPVLVAQPAEAAPVSANS